MKSKITNVVVRTALAAIFGFMSLLHAPIMASANMASAGAHHVAQADLHADEYLHHSHHRYHGAKSTPAVPDAVPSCYGIGCFVVLNPKVASTPAVSPNHIATLAPADDNAMVPTYLDPPVPPPRSQV
jgi:hypothetical protein